MLTTLREGTDAFCIALGGQRKNRSVESSDSLMELENDWIMEILCLQVD